MRQILKTIKRVVEVVIFGGMALVTFTTANAANAETFSIAGFALNTNINIRRFDGFPEVIPWQLISTDPDMNFIKAPSNIAGAFTLQNQTTNGCLNSHYGLNSRTNAWYPCDKNDQDMAWKIVNQNGGYWLQNYRSGLCLTMPTAKANYGIISMQSCSSTNPNQIWTIGNATTPPKQGYYDSLVSWSDTTWENAINSGAAITTINNNPNLDHAKVYRDLSNDLFGRFFPIGGAYISDDYYRETGGTVGYHGAIDISADFGTPVKTIVSGKVVLIAPKWGLLTIQDAIGNNHIYMHLDKVFVSVGQSVTAGQIVANTGKTGASSPHLHYEIARNLYPYGALQGSIPATKDGFRERTFNPLKDYWLMRRR